MDAMIMHSRPCASALQGSRCSSISPSSLHSTARNRRISTRAEQSAEANPLKKMLKRVQSALPVVGLISRLASPEGGVASDDLAYTEYSRAVFEAAPQGFQIAVAELQNRHGNGAQRRYILLALWMTQYGTGLLPAKNIVDGIRRLRVSQDIEFEMERFLQAFEEESKKYNYMDRPRGRPQDQADIAVDSLARLCLNLKDGQPIADEDAELIVDAVSGGLMGSGPAFKELVRQSVATRAERATAYV